MKKYLFIIVAMGGCVSIGSAMETSSEERESGSVNKSVEDEVTRAIIGRDVTRFKKLLPSDVEKAESIANEKIKQLLVLAQSVESTQEQKSQLDVNKAQRSCLLKGAGLVSIGVGKGIFDLVYRSQSTGLYSAGLATDAGAVFWGGFYLYAGIMKKDPKKELAKATEIASLLQGLLVKRGLKIEEESTQEKSEES